MPNDASSKASEVPALSSLKTLEKSGFGLFTSSFYCPSSWQCPILAQKQPTVGIKTFEPLLRNWGLAASFVYWNLRVALNFRYFLEMDFAVDFGLPTGDCLYQLGIM